MEFHHLVNEVKIFLAPNFFTLTYDIKYESHINEYERKPIGFGILHRKQKCMTTEHVVRMEFAIWCLFRERKPPRKGINILLTYIAKVNPSG